MQNMSKAYKESMNAQCRNRGYIKATIGVINSEAQKYVSVSSRKNSLAYFANCIKPFDSYTVDRIYATGEQDFSKVDGSMYFLPEKAEDVTYNNGIVTEGLLGTIYISFQGRIGFDIKGLTIDWGDCYPVDFTIQNDTVTYSYEGNHRRHWTTEDVFNGTSYFIITPTKMSCGQDRLRIYQFSCGIVNTFNNKETISFTSREYVSSITETIPSMDMSLTVDNQNLYYSPDNPDSVLAYMEVGQEMKVSFGYDVKGNGVIEWLPEVTAYLKTWSATDIQAKFTATDRFDYFSGTYYKGLYREDGISLYDLAMDVLEDAGITDARGFFIDPYLKNIIVNNPMPVVSHSEALQIIANAGRCVLFEDRKSRIHMQSSFIPDMAASTNNETVYSNVENILNNEPKDAYAMTSNDFSVVDGSVFFMPRDENYLNVGYVSESVWLMPPKGTMAQRFSFRLGSKENYVEYDGEWNGSVPKIIIHLEAGFVSYGLLIQFRNVAPREFIIKTFYQDVFVGSMTARNTELEYVTNERFELFDRMEIEFTRGYPNARVTVDHIRIGDVTDYTLSRKNSLIGSPVATRQNKVKSINVNRIVFQKNSLELLDIITEEIVLPAGETEYTVYFTEPYTDLSVFLENDVSVSVAIIDSSNFFATILFSGIQADHTMVKFTVRGHEYIQNEQWLVKKYHESGEVKKWSNPLISTAQHASDLEEWLATYYLGDVDYQIKWRGDPRTDANDLFYLELANQDKVMIRCYQNELSFNGAWSGTMNARKAVL